MIGKIILGIWVACEIGLHIIKWGQDMPVKTIGISSIMVDIFDVAMVIAIVSWW